MLNRLISILVALLLSWQLMAQDYNPWSFQLHFEYNARPASPWNPRVEQPVRDLTTYIRQRLPLSEQLVQNIQDWKNERVDHENSLSEIEQKKFELMQQMTSFLKGENSDNLPAHLRATPIPTNMTSEQALAPLKGLFDSLEAADFVKSVDEVNKLIHEIALKKSLGIDTHHTNFLESEIKREMVNSAGIVRHLPFAPVPQRPYRSALWNARGSALVQTTNELLSTQSSLSLELKEQCSRGLCPNDKLALVNDRRLYERTKTLIETLALSDSLRSLGRNSTHLEQLVKNEIATLQELSKSLPPNQALERYLETVVASQREMIQELERLRFQSLIHYSRPVSFDESHLGDHLLASEDQLLLKNASLSECINSYQLCRSKEELLAQDFSPVMNSEGVELDASVAHRGLRQTLEVKSQLDSSSVIFEEAKFASQKVLTSASQSFAELDNETGSSLYEVGVLIADIALGVTPVIGVAKDAYELVMGRNLLTGDVLSQTELVLAGVGVLTLGLAKPIQSGVRFLSKLEVGKDVARIASEAFWHSRKIITEIKAYRFNKIRQTPWGSRPDVATYLSPSSIKQHLDSFEGGASKVMVRSDYRDYGLLHRDGTSFVLPKESLDQFLSTPGASISRLERMLGYERGALHGKDIIVVDIPRPQSLGLRMANGNESGANRFWLPGGLLPTGVKEAVIDVRSVERGKDYIVRNLNLLD